MYYKAVTKSSHLSFYDRTTHWAPGKILSVDIDAADDGRQCGAGLHVCHTIQGCTRYQMSVADYFEVEPITVIHEGRNKIRCQSVRVGRLLGRAELLEASGGADIFFMNRLELVRKTNPILSKNMIQDLLAEVSFPRSAIPTSYYTIMNVYCHFKEYAYKHFKEIANKEQINRAVDRYQRSLCFSGRGAVRVLWENGYFPFHVMGDQWLVYHNGESTIYYVKNMAEK